MKNIPVSLSDVQRNYNLKLREIVENHWQKTINEDLRQDIEVIFLN